MSEGLIEGAWAGRRAFILGGGPSLATLDLYDLRDELTLGLNMAFLHEPTANLIYDLRLMESLDGSPMWKAYRGHKFWLNSEMPNIPHDVCPFDGTRQLRPARMDSSLPRWPSTLAGGIYRGNNAGTAGVSLVDILGADPIYLLGFDMRAEAGKPANWHEMYPEEWKAKESTLKTFREDLTRIKGHVRRRVINLTPGSALDAFPKESLADVLGVPR
jgi:hypothetical protein